MYITRDDTGLVQLWENKPQEFKDNLGRITFGSHHEIGVEVNSIESLRNMLLIHNKLEIFACPK